MTQAGYRHRIIIRDRSFSVRSYGLTEGFQSGYDEFVASEAALPGRVTFSVWDFDDEILNPVSFGTPESAAGLKIVPRGNTALFDAVGRAVVTEGEKLAAVPEDERPEDVTLIITTDGEENCSQEYRGPQVAELLKRQQEGYSWRVLFNGPAGIDVFAQAGSVGVGKGSSLSYALSAAGAAGNYRASANLLRRAPVAGGQSVNMTYSAADIALANPGVEPEPEEDSPAAGTGGGE